MTFALGLIVLLALMILGVPIGFALGLAGVASLALIVPAPVILGLMTQVVHATAASYVLLTIPMFVLMAEFLSAGGVAQDLMLACNRMLRRVRGGLAMACVFAGALLASASGSSTASVASITRASYPTMRRLGYDCGFSVGTISIAGTLAIMIPPSIAFVVYGLMTDVSIGKLFIAGVLPGLLTAAGYIATIALLLWRRPGLAPTGASPNVGGDVGGDSAGLEGRGQVWPIVLLVAIVLGCLYGGVATPTEVGALGALAAGLISLGLGRMTGRRFATAVGNTLRTTALIVTIIFGAHLFGYFISFTHVTDQMLTWIAASGLSRYSVLLLVVLVYLGLGMVMDQFAIIILTAPISYALVTGLGFDGVWFGVIIVKTAEIGLVSPPMGLNVFIAASAAEVDARAGFAGVLPFIVTELVILALLIAVPEIVLYLPGTM
ncbi:TRAP transporter, DctM subunit [Tistlia consotensis]|uniref:TRAP transporter large permease protein n=1 Tax=Tistlia consotensis USBA 355 TaxID=560819 RepID=A0A1Y6CN62_9PROT|nr:TRAP transporter large permease subunit [Tistlia consotensis]SMF65835.1 TRAP transporter, DctM subunit [Tistlia consotensis USBA 355]SNS03093.1 TRAP transporter, DctM subunit [Tistlia consotensis]